MAARPRTLALETCEVSEHMIRPVGADGRVMSTGDRVMEGWCAQGMARSVQLSEVAHVAGIEQTHLPASFKATLTGSQVEVDLAQGYAAAVHEALAADTGKEADLLVEITSLLPLVGPVFSHR